MLTKKTTETLKEALPALPILIGEASLHHDIDDLVAIALPKMSMAVIDDVNTCLAFGDKIAKATKTTTHLTLADNVKADDQTIELIRNKTKTYDALIAVGSGTINDLCKYAAHLDNKPYIIFPTAASMNGYLSANASITLKDHKTTLPATLPLAVFCDFSVITSAPIRLSKSGLGDSLARPTAQADWLFSHLLLGTNYNDLPFQLLKDPELELFDNAAGIAKNDPETIKKLMETLLLSGLGMTIAGGSYPASQAEHMIAHTYHMLTKHSTTLHGEEIAITSLYMAELQHNLLRHPPQNIEILSYSAIKMQQLFGKELSDEFEIEYEKKSSSLQAENATIQNQPVPWDSIREKLLPITISPAAISAIIRKAELPSTPESIGWNINQFTTACQFARYTRNRFTFLDITPPNTILP